MQDGPLVSICIPVYNGDKYIDETISCCINQTYKNLEIIISDNCSTDNTIQLIKRYNDPRIKIFSNACNIGLEANYRKALTYATGKYMAFLGADDGMTLDAVEKEVAIMESPEFKNIVLVNTYIQIINDESKNVFLKKFIFGGGPLSAFWGIRSNFLYGSNTIGEPNGSLFKREAYEKIPEPKFRNGNKWTLDLDMKFELMLQGDSYMIPEPLGQFRISSQSTSNKELKFTQAKLFRQYAMAIYRDKRYNLSFFWVITATINSWILQIARNVFYILFISKKNV
ncbi:MAG: glycosyltransferase family 2 protein [Bacteroidetes bacterium]|nr:glycosyltransferase family 2 protein [Bacteroidota bacterium]